jgi:hypothetical protein
MAAAENGLLKFNSTSDFSPTYIVSASQLIKSVTKCSPPVVEWCPGATLTGIKARQ